MRRTVHRDGPHPIDVFVGEKMRTLRTLKGMSQSKMGEALGLTFQQIQKYEKGSNRVSASRLWELHELLDVPITEFFPGSGGVNVDGDLHRRQTLELIRAFYQIPESRRKQVYELVRSMGYDD